MCSVSDYQRLNLTEYHAETVRNELEMWHRSYLPVHGTVLDVGAGCGETAFFYLNHGAERVVCVEGDPEALECLRKNFGSDPRVIIIPLMIDSLKIDVEGSEKNMIVETHFPPVFRQVEKLNQTTSLWKILPDVALDHRNVVSVCISRDYLDSPLPNFFCYTAGYKPFGRSKTKERVEYLAARRNAAVEAALKRFPDAEHILMVDSYYVFQLAAIKRLLDDYVRTRKLILGASTWWVDKTRITPRIRFYDIWTTRGQERKAGNRARGIAEVNAVGACYVFPRSFWAARRYGIPHDWTPDYGCEHNFLCEGQSCFLDYDAKLYREPIIYSMSKRIRCSLGSLRRRLNLQISSQTQ